MWPDVFEKVANVSLKSYGLCLSHYLSASALSSDAMLNITKFELELISYTDVHLFFEKGRRGGVSYISKRYSKVNDIYLKSYGPIKSQNITYTLTRIIFMVVRCLSFFQQIDLNGCTLKSLSWTIMTAIAEKVVFYNWILIS